MKVLIVLDDIDEIDQLEYLAGDVGWFGNGSRVVVTTRNRHLIEKDDAIYDVPTLHDHEAMQLFNQHAFKKEVPDEHFKLLSLEVVNHAKGLPLALRVWGSLLHKKDLNRWRRTIDQIKKNSSSQIVEKLKISYDGLGPEEQKIFLDMACFFRGHEIEEVMQILKSCDFGAEYGLDVLIDKSLVFVSEDDTIEMHDLIQDMGRYVVKMQKDLGELSRIWDAKNFEEVMLNNTGTNTEAIWLEGTTHDLCFSKKAMKNMKRLRILYIRDFGTFDDFIEYLPNNLRCFRFCEYPGESLPENFEPKRLVHLDLQYSSLHHLWIGTKHFPSLRCLHLGCSELRRTPDFTGMPNLEYLDLEYCSSLEEVHPSLKCCGKLIRLNLLWCGSLERFPYVNVESLEYLDLERCSSLEKFPEILGRMKPELEIHIEGSAIRELPLSIIQHQAHLTELYLTDMENLVALPSSICMLKGFVKLIVRGCSKLESLPEEIGDLENLEVLHASYTLISQPPPSIVRLNKLKCLDFEKQKSEDGVFFVFPQVNEGLRSLEILNLSWCNLIDGRLPEDIGCLSSLKELKLRGNNFEHLPRSIAQLGALRSLDLEECKRLKELPGFMGMPNLGTLNLSNCINLEEVHHSLGFLEKLWKLELTNCKRLKRFPSLCINSLEYLNLKGCSSLEIFSEILGSMNLDLGDLENLVTLPSSICKLKSLVEINVSGCSKLQILPEEIGDLENLEKLDATCTLISRPPPSIIRLNKLKFLAFAKENSEVGFEDRVYFVFPQVKEGLRSLEILDLSWCKLIDGGLPEDIGCLSSLKVLYLRGNNFEHLPRSIAQLGALRSLDLSHCKRLTQLPDFTGMPNLETLNLSYCDLIDGGLPEDIGCLSSLKDLNLSGNNFDHLPQSIAQLGALRSLDLSHCKRLTQLPEFPEQLDTIYADWSNDLICNSLFQNISSLQHDVSASDSLSLRVFTTGKNIPSWFHHRGIDRSVSVSLPENWYVHDNFLGFAVCYSGRLIDITAHLIPLCDDGVSSMTQKLALSNLSECGAEPKINFFLVPFPGLWDNSKENGKTPNDYGIISLLFGEMKDFGLRLLYKDEPELEAVLQMRENNDEPIEHRVVPRKRRYDSSEHHDYVTNEASCSSSKKQRSCF